MTKSATFAEVLVALERQYPSYETDLSIRTEIQNLAVLSNNPKAARISELPADLDHSVGRLIPVLIAATSCNSGWWPRSQETCGMNVGQGRSARQEPSPMRTCLCYFESWRWRKKATST